MVDVLTVKMLVSKKGSPDGRRTETYVKGESYEFRTASEVDLGQVFIREEWAVDPAAEPVVAPPEEKQLPSVDLATKQAPAPPEDKGRGRGRRRRV